MMTDKDLTDDVLDEIIAGAKTSMEQYLALSLKAERAANRQQNSQQNIPEIIPFEQWLSQQTGTIDVECGCVMTEVFFHWLRVAYEAGNSPVIPDGWVACSERMPDVGDVVLTAKDGFVNVGEMERSGANYRYFTSIASGRELPATHWQPLPAAPQQEVK